MRNLPQVERLEIGPDQHTRDLAAWFLSQAALIRRHTARRIPPGRQRRRWITGAADSIAAARAIRLGDFTRREVAR